MSSQALPALSARATGSPLYLIVASHPSVALAQGRLAELVVHELVPMLDDLAARPEQKVGWHLGGHLLDHLARHHEGFLLRLRTFVSSGQIEVLGGPFYGCAAALLSEADVRGQVAMAAEFWESFLGSAPIGCLLPEMAWAAELPRLLHDTGLAYGVLGKAQVSHGQAACPSFGQLSRGGLKLFALCVDEALSRPLNAAVPGAIGAFCVAARASLAAEAAQPFGHGAAAVLQAAGLGPIPGQGAATGFGRLLDALAAADIRLELPRACIKEPLAAVPMVLKQEYAPLFASPKTAEAPQPGGADGPALAADVGRFAANHIQSWTEFPARFAASELLYRRMLRASARLHAAIGQMEDHGLSDAWSGQLACAQRAIFRAQSAEAFGAGESLGFVDMRVRDATLRAIRTAEDSLDQLQLPEAQAKALPAHMGPGALAVSGQVQVALPLPDADEGPGADDLFVRTGHATLWLEPRRGSVRSVEPIAQLAAPGGARAAAEGGSQAGAGGRSSQDASGLPVPNVLDAWTAAALTTPNACMPLAGGICDAAWPHPTAEGGDQASGTNNLADAWPTEWMAAGGEGPGTQAAPNDASAFSLRLKGRVAAPWAHGLTLEKAIEPNTDSVGARITMVAHVSEPLAATYGFSLPLRLNAAHGATLEIDGEAATKASGERVHVQSVRLTHSGHVYADIKLSEQGAQRQNGPSPWTLLWQPGACGLAEGHGGFVLTFVRPIGTGFASAVHWQS